MQVRRITLVALVVALAASGQWPLPISGAAAAQTPTPAAVPRPPTLTTGDVPAGYRELASSIPVENVPAESRIWIRTEQGPGPSSITNVTLVRPAPTPEEYMARLRSEFAAQGPVAQPDENAVLTDCVELNAAAIGEEALFYKCRSDWMESVIPPAGSATENEMATIVFRRGYLVSQISVTRADGSPDEDVRRYVGLLDARQVAYITNQH